AAEGDLTFAEDGPYRDRVKQSQATAVIVSSVVEGASANLLVVKRPKLAFARVLALMEAKAHEPVGVSPDLLLGEGSRLGEAVSVHPRVVIGRRSIIGDRAILHPGVVIGDDCRIGDDSVLHPNVCLYAKVEIGRRVVIHAGTVIGSDGFGF